ncbi:MAG TPA: ABC transporter substrate-binding protein [Anaeromyxobacteraceae bacterium]|nr:ABC transporter substrate-binding protein [Anaeromyxobacteraceae bacterium]
MKHRLAAAALAILSLTSGVPAAGAAERPSAIRIGVAGTGTGGRPVTGGSYVSFAADAGALEAEFKKDGIPVRYTYFSGAGPAVNEALANGQLDFAYQGDLPALVAKAGGLPTKLILAVNRYSAIYVGVPSDSPAKSLEDLKGKRIAVFKGTNLQLAFWNVLAAKGLKESDFKIINMSTFDGNAALLSKDVDAQVSGNDLFPLVDRGVARIVHSTKGDAKLGRLSHVLVTEDFAKRFPGHTQRLVNVLLGFARWGSDEGNRARSYQIWTKSGLSLPAWRSEYDGESIALRNSPLFDDFYRAQYKRLLKAGRDLRLVRRDFDVDAWLDPTFLDRGLATLGLVGFWPEQDADGRQKPGSAVGKR